MFSFPTRGPALIPPTPRLILGLALLLLLAPPVLAGGGTIVPGGPVNGTWTLAGSPYIVTGDVVAQGLTIEPGVLVQVDGPWQIEVRTVLHADGTADSPIVFTALDPDVRWRGIYFHRCPATPNLDHCRIELAQASGIRVFDSQVILRSCEVRNCTSPQRGGGISVDIGSGVVQLIDCVISDCISKSSGGGLFVLTRTGGVVQLRGCRIVNNQSNPTLVFPGLDERMHFDTQGGGVYVIGNAELEDCTVTGNRGVSRQAVGVALARGGGLFAEDGSVSLLGCVFANNDAHAMFDYVDSGGCISYGGGAYVDSGSLSVKNTIFGQNICSGEGGLGQVTEGSGLYANSGVTTLENTTVAFNSDEGIRRAGGSLSLLNGIVWGNVGAALVGEMSVTYSCIETGGPVFPGEGNIAASPLLAGPSPSCTGYVLAAGSPAVDAGNPGVEFQDVCFPPSQGAARNDLGAFGGPGACVFGPDCGGPGDPPVLVATFTMPKSVWTMGEVARATTHVTNGPEARSVDAYLWIRLPDGSTVVHRRRRAFAIEPAFDFSRDEILGTAGSFPLADTGLYTFGIRLVDATTGATLTQHLDTFRIVRQEP